MPITNETVMDLHRLKTLLASIFLGHASVIIARSYMDARRPAHNCTPIGPRSLPVPLP